MKDEQNIVELYESQQPTGKNTYECVKEVAYITKLSPNYIRRVLQEAGVYVVKEKPKETKVEETKKKRLSKAEAHQMLINVVSDAGSEIDEEIVSKMTGKAAAYFAELILELLHGE
jgi:uncharacterized membrane-anchored protein